jgi:transcriptional regulator with XRE-family HTH domain
MKKVNLKFISQRRNEMKITLQEMATTLGFKNASTYMKYEIGDYAFKADHMPKMAQRLGCEIEDLFYEESFADLANKRSPA